MGDHGDQITVKNVLLGSLTTVVIHDRPWSQVYVMTIRRLTELNFQNQTDTFTHNMNSDGGYHM